MVYGPPPDAREIPFAAGPSDAPGAWALSVALGLGLTALALWRRPPAPLRALCFTLGQTLLLTAPLAGLLNQAWYGAFPTIDKEGSLLFYLDGVHLRQLLHPVAALSDPAVRLIGVHLGHLWPVAAADLLLSPMGAFNASALLYPALGWWAAWLLCRAVCGDERLAMVAAMPFGLGLHVFRDLNWYTIEKASVFWLGLYLWALWRAAREGGRWPLWAGLIYAGMSWWNLYFGLLGAALGGLALVAAVFRGSAPEEGPLGLPGRAELLRRVGLSCLICALLASPLVVTQALLMRGGPALGTPEQFLWQRAALDALTLWPPRWDRLELWGSAAPPLLALGAWAAWRERKAVTRFALGAGLGIALLALGPGAEAGPHNPLYLGLVRLIPGLWRLAKPEVFFEGTLLLGLALGSLGLARLIPPVRRKMAVILLYALSVLAWLALVRTHPAFPAFSAPVESHLSPGWERRVFGGHP